MSSGGGTMGGRKLATPNPLTMAAKAEHALVGMTLLDIIGPRLTEEVCFVSFNFEVRTALLHSPPTLATM